MKDERKLSEVVNLKVQESKLKKLPGNQFMLFTAEPFYYKELTQNFLLTLAECQSYILDWELNPLILSVQIGEKFVANSETRYECTLVFEEYPSEYLDNSEPEKVESVKSNSSDYNGISYYPETLSTQEWFGQSRTENCYLRSDKLEELQLGEAYEDWVLTGYIIGGEVFINGVAYNKVTLNYSQAVANDKGY